MKNHDELMAMNEQQRQAYLETEVEKIIQRADPKHQLKLRAAQARLDGVRRRYRNAPPIVTADLIYAELLESLMELAKALKGVAGNVE